MSPQWVDAGPADAAVESEPFCTEVGGLPIVIVRCEDACYAIDDCCTHDGESFGAAEVDGREIICPLHGARFCLRTGQALTPPAYEPVRTYRVREADGRLQVEIPD